MKFEYARDPGRARSTTAKEWREKMVESAAEANEELMNKYLEEGDLSEEEIKNGLRQRTIASEIVPMLCGSAFKNKGVQAMLDAVIELHAGADRHSAGQGRARERQPKASASAADDEPFAGLAFKIMTDPYVGQLTFFRVYSGVMKSGDTIYNPIKGRKERIGRILQMHANQREEIKEVLRRRHRRGGRPEGSDHRRHAVRPGQVDHAREHDLPRAGDPRRRRAEDQGRPGEDGHRAQPPGAGRPVVPRAHRRGIGPDDHLRHGRAAPGNHRRPHEARVRRRGQRRRAAGGLPRSDPQVGRGEGKFVKQSGGRGQYGHVWLKLEPNEPGKGFEFVDAIKGGTVPREYIPAVEKGLARDAAERRAGRLPGRRRQGHAVRRFATTTSTRTKTPSRWRRRWPSRTACARPARCCSSR